jgi:ABC-type glycerol-3-phosphate transport system permease component
MAGQNLALNHRQSFGEKLSFKAEMARRHWARRGKNEQIALLITFVILLIYALSLLYPLFWVAYNSLKTSRQFNNDQFGWPSSPQWSNYSAAWNIEVGYKKTILDQIIGRSGHKVYLWETFINSVWMTLLRVSLELLFAAPTAYVIAKYHFKGSSFIYSLAVFIQIIPLVGSLPANYQWIVGTLGIADNPFTIIPVWCVSFGFSFFILYSAFKSLPWAYAESGLIEGANHLQIFLKIMLPQVLPVLSALFVVNSIAVWGDYMTPYLFMKDYPTMSLAIYSLQEDSERTGGVPMFFSVIVLSIIPTLTVFLLSQKTIMSNYAAGGLKE